ncbi:flagellar basal body P-ring biosynthesis protein FlgA [compost metagenome]
MNRQTIKKTISLPLFAIASALRGSYFSASCGLIALLFITLPAAAWADSELNAQIEQATSEHLAQRLSAQAQREHWQGMRFTQKLLALPADAPTAACTAPLTVRAATDGPVLPGRQRLDLLCPTQPGWSLTVAVQVSVFVQAVVAAQVLERGGVISADMLERREVSVSKNSRGLFSHIDEVAGLSAKRRIRSQQVLSQDMLVSPWLVRRGERVSMVARHGEIQAVTQGEALENGRKGQVIRVKNLASGSIIDAQVTEPGTVTSTFNPAQK